jgi:hypothetical protein
MAVCQALTVACALGRFLKDLPADNAAAAALQLLASASTSQQREVLVCFVSGLAPTLSEALLGRLQVMQLGVATLSRISQPWNERLAHLIG